MGRHSASFLADVGVRPFAEAQAGPLGPKFQALVEQIGYHRSMATASALSLGFVVIFNWLGHRHLPLILMGATLSPIHLALCVPISTLLAIRG